MYVRETNAIQLYCGARRLMKSRTRKEAIYSALLFCGTIHYFFLKNDCTKKRLLIYSAVAYEDSWSDLP